MLGSRCWEEASRKEEEAEDMRRRRCRYERRSVVGVAEVGFHPLLCILRSRSIVQMC
jgi:hypothetical protein